MTSFIRIDEPAQPAAGFALWQLGFRPFYLLASAFAALSIALWALQFSGWLTHPYLSGAVWHAHEMLFGFTLAVVVGFLFTAGANWTGRPTPTGLALAALAALWVAGRVLVLTPWVWAAAVVNMAFPLAAAIGLAIPFFKSGNRRNYFFVALLLMMALASLAVHLDQIGVAQFPTWLGIQVALDGVLFIMAVMAGRVVPMFTNNGVRGATATRHPVVEKIALGSVLALLLADAITGLVTESWTLHGRPLAWVAAVCAVAHLARWLLWKPWQTLGNPMVWVLQAAYAWVPIHLGLRALAELGWVAPSAATHALTVGAAGGLIMGMMVRTARGHTGRVLKANRFEVACFVMVLLAAFVRVFLPMVAPALLMLSVQVSALLWSTAFGLYAVTYWPVLTRARVDGRPG